MNPFWAQLTPFRGHMGPNTARRQPKQYPSWFCPSTWTMEASRAPRGSTGAPFLVISGHFGPAWGPTSKMLPRYPGWFSATFSATAFFSVGNGNLMAVWPVLALGTQRNSGPGRETQKCNFPVLEALLRGKSSRPKSFSQKLRNFFHTFRFGRPDPQGRKIAK